LAFRRHHGGNVLKYQEYCEERRVLPLNPMECGLFHVGLDHVPPALDTLRDGLKALGYEEGQTIHLDWRNLPDEAAAHDTAKAFVRERVDLMVAFEGDVLV